jgi:6-phosphogluconolactonase
MSRSARAEVRVHPDLEALSRAAAESLAAVAAEVAGERGRFTVALPGGNTPRRLHALLASDHREAIPWDRVEVFWGDERYIPHDDPRSDYRMARETLLDHVPIPPENVHPIATHFADPGEAARRYEAVLREHFAGEGPRFDLILLGLGEEGHTASLFPESPALEETTRWVVAAEVPVEPRVRVTLTLPAINQAARVWVLAAGAGKAEAVARALSERPEVAACPAAGVRPARGELVWWVDEEAAGAARL